MSTRFGAEYRVYAIDQRNHGDSPHADAFSYEAMAADLFEFCEEQGVASAAVLGHSMGGKTAMQFALLHPEKVERLIVVEISPRAYPPGHDGILAALADIDLQAYATRDEVERALSPRIPDDAVRKFLLTNLTRDDRLHFRWKMNLDSLRRNSTAIAAALSGGYPFRGRTLFIAGANSRYIMPEDRPLIQKLFPASRIATVPGAGHWVHADAPEEFARIVLGFLREHS